MKTHYAIEALCFLFFLSTGVGAQSWRFPDCRDLFITKVEIPVSIEDKLYITVASQCDTCHQHVYTGLMVYSGSDTLAVEDVLYSKPSPDNNAVHRYTLDILSPFSFNESLRVEMVGGLCDSLSFAADWITSVEESFDQSSVTVFPNPSQGGFQVRMMETSRVKATKLYDSAGRLLRDWTYLPRIIDPPGEAKGIFWLYILTAKGQVRRKLVRL